MSTVPLPAWNAQGVLPSFVAPTSESPTRHERQLFAERSVVQTVLAETPEHHAATRVYLLRRLAQVDRELVWSSATLMKYELRHDEQTLTGEFVGVLPTCREFEFRLQNSSEVIHGYVSYSIPDPATLNKHLRRPERINVTATTVNSGPPCFRLIGVVLQQEGVGEVKPP